MEKYYKWFEEKKTKHNLVLNANGLFVISIISAKKQWYLSANRLGIPILYLETNDLETAKKKAIAFIKTYVNNLAVELEKI